MEGDGLRSTSDARHTNDGSAFSRAQSSLENSDMLFPEVAATSAEKRRPITPDQPLNPSSAKRGQQQQQQQRRNKPHPRSSSFTNPNPPSTAQLERPRLHSKLSYDATMKPNRVAFETPTHQQNQSPRLTPQQQQHDTMTDLHSDIGKLSLSAPARPSSPARTHSSSSAYTNRTFTSRSKSKSQLNLVTMQAGTGAASGSPTSTSSFNKRRETISNSPNYPSRNTATPPGSLHASVRNAGDGSGTRYYAQEKAYLKKIQHDTYSDYSNRTLGNVIAHSDVDSDSDDELDMLPKEAMGLGGVGTSFDDEYTDSVTSYPFLEASYNHEEMENDESLPERLEWQAMLASVLTGEVVQSEKRRLKTTTDVTIKEDDLWIEIRARMCSRTFEAQKRKIEDARANVEPTFMEILQFQVTDPSDLELTLKEVNKTLEKLETCESLWRTLKKVRAASALYRDPMFQRHVDALRSWSTTTEWIFREIHLLQVLTGNEAADPTLPPDGSLKSPMIESTSLVERVLKQEDLMKVFNKKIKLNIGPVIQRTRDAHLEYKEEFLQIGLPVYVEGLEKLMKFPIMLIQEIVSLRLVYAKRMTNPTVMLVDQTIEDLSRYMNLALLVKERNIEYTSPVTDIPWITYTPDSRFDKTVLDCVVFFFELSSSKFIDNSFSQAHRGFNEIDNFLAQYKFLEQVGRFVKGGEIVVAIQSW